MGLRQALSRIKNEYSAGYESGINATKKRSYVDENQRLVEKAQGRSAIFPDSAKDWGTHAGEYVSAFQQSAPAGMGYASGRITQDFFGNGTLTKWWRFNHALAINDVIAEEAIGKMQGMNANQKALARTVPTFALAGAAGNFAWNNLGQAGRPQGFSVLNPVRDEEGKIADRTKSENVPAEYFGRYITGRTGRLLPWEDFQKERPDVDFDTYSNYRKYLYQDKGVDGLGILKGSARGLNEPEFRVFGYRVPASGVAGSAGALGGLAAAARMLPGNMKHRTAAILAAGYGSGMAAGTATKHLSNALLKRREKDELR